MMLNERRPLPPNGRFLQYLRKSRDEMRQEKLYGGDVLAKHKMMLDYAAEMNGHAIGHVFREVVSGETIAARPEMRELIRQVDAGQWDGAYIMAVDRLSRGSQQDQGIICDLLEITGLFIVTPSGYFDPWNPNDMDTIRYQLFNSNNEFRSYSRRMQDSIRTSVMGGQYIGAYVPFGYDKHKLDNGFKTLRPNDDARYVKMMFDWAGNDDMSLYAIAKRLTEMGVKPPRGTEGKDWAPTTVGTILSNEVYIGQAKWGKHKTQRTFTTDALDRRKVRRLTDSYAIAEGEWEPLVTPELFELVKRRRERRLPVSTDNSNLNIFAGMIVCSSCGRAMTTMKDRGRFRIVHKVGFKCKMKGTFESVVVEKLIDALRAKLMDIEFSVGGDDARAERERAIESIENLEKQIAKLDDRAKFLLTMRTNQEITAAEFAQARQEIAEDRERSCDLIEQARIALDRTEDRSELAGTIHAAIDMLSDDSVSRTDKNRFLRTFIDKVEYENFSEHGMDDKLRLNVVFL